MESDEIVFQSSQQEMTIFYCLNKRRVMIVKEYVDRLKELKEDRNKFERFKDKTNFSSKFTRQENKYQAYIIDQMMDRDKLIAATTLRDIITASTLRDKIYSFKAIKRDTHESKTTIEANIRPSLGNSSTNSTRSNGMRDQTITVDFILVKLCSDVIKRQLQKAMGSILKETFNEIKKYSHDKAVLIRMAKNMKKYHYRYSLRAIAQTSNVKLLLTEGKIFDESFSMIVRNDNPRKERMNMEESYLSLILDKENHQIDCKRCQQPSKIESNSRIETVKLREELSYLKSLLVEKNLELRKRNEQCERLRQANENKERVDGHRQDESEIYSRNSSYYVEMEKQILGGCRIRKNGSRASNSQISNRSELGRELLGKELLGKYMNECFQMRENMDVARQLCLEIQQILKGDSRLSMAQVIRILSKNDEISVDQAL